MPTLISDYAREFYSEAKARERQKAKNRLRCESDRHYRREEKLDARNRKSWSRILKQVEKKVLRAAASGQYVCVVKGFVSVPIWFSDDKFLVVQKVYSYDTMVRLCDWAKSQGLASTIQPVYQKRLFDSYPSSVYSITIFGWQSQS